MFRNVFVLYHKVFKLQWILQDIFFSVCLFHTTGILNTIRPESNYIDTVLGDDNRANIWASIRHVLRYACLSYIQYPSVEIASSNNIICVI